MPSGGIVFVCEYIHPRRGFILHLQVISYVALLVKLYSAWQWQHIIPFLEVWVISSNCSMQLSTTSISIPLLLTSFVTTDNVMKDPFWDGLYHINRVSASVLSQSTQHCHQMYDLTKTMIFTTTAGWLIGVQLCGLLVVILRLQRLSRIKWVRTRTPKRRRWREGNREHSIRKFASLNDKWSYKSFEICFLGQPHQSRAGHVHALDNSNDGKSINGMTSWTGGVRT